MSLLLAPVPARRTADADAARAAVLAPAPPAADLAAFKLGKCGSCIALCCRYFALEVDRPTTPGDFEDLRWYLLHERVNIFIEGRRWFLQVFNRCSALGDDNRCTIYATRPKICRTYDNDLCDKDEAEGKTQSDHVFRSAADLEAYRQVWLKRYRARLRNSRREATERRARKARRVAAAQKRRRTAAARGR